MFLRDCRPTDELFSHQDLEGVSRHFNTTAMTCAVMARKIQPSLIMLPLERWLVDHILQNNGVEPQHIEAAKARAEVPILVVVFPDDTTLIVDGNHRIVARYAMGLPTVEALQFFPGQWDEFLVTDIDVPLSLYGSQAQDTSLTVGA